MSIFNKLDKIASEIIIDYYTHPTFTLNLWVLEDTYGNELEWYTDECRPDAKDEMKEAYKREFKSYVTPANMLELMEASTEDELYVAFEDVYGRMDEETFDDAVDHPNYDLSLYLYDPFEAEIFKGSAWLMARRELEKKDNSVYVDIKEYNHTGKPMKEGKPYGW